MITVHRVYFSASKAVCRLPAFLRPSCSRLCVCPPYWVVKGTERATPVNPTFPNGWNLPVRAAGMGGFFQQRVWEEGHISLGGSGDIGCPSLACSQALELQVAAPGGLLSNKNELTLSFGVWGISPRLLSSFREKLVSLSRKSFFPCGLNGWFVQAPH